VERLLVPLTAGLFFLPPERYSALVLFGLLAQTVRRLPRLRIGAFTGPMTEVLAAPLAAAVERAGGQVRTSTPVERLLVSAGRVQGVRAGGERLRAGHVVLATVLADAERLGLDLAGTLRAYQVVRLAEDFMSLAPGHAALHPAQRTPVAGLTPAGDWTAQPFLATMEGAVVSGRRAARVVLEAGTGAAVATGERSS
jgi:uncharacterized protein with NAD-binding domain and iron-sulfur cluster